MQDPCRDIFSVFRKVHMTLRRPSEHESRLDQMGMCSRRGLPNSGLSRTEWIGDELMLLMTRVQCHLVEDQDYHLSCAKTGATLHEDSFPPQLPDSGNETRSVNALRSPRKYEQVTEYCGSIAK